MCVQAVYINNIEMFTDFFINIGNRQMAVTDTEP